MSWAPVLAALVGVVATGCGRSATPDAAPTPVTLPGGPVDLDLGRPPIRNPLNLRDVDVDGAPSYDVVGTIDGAPVHAMELDQPSGQALTHVGERIYAGRDRGWRWLLEQTGLARRAAAAGLSLEPWLRRTFAELPAPTDDELEEEARAASLRDLPDDERRAASTSLFRLRTWAILRSVRVAEGLTGLAYERYQLPIAEDAYADLDAVVAEVGDRELTRAELRALGGYDADVARHEYWQIARDLFEQHVGAALFAREAERLGITPDEVELRALAAAPAVTDDDVAAFVRDNPEYARDPKGQERARDQVRRLNQIAARDALTKRLRDAADVRFLLEEPVFTELLAEPPAPRRHGPDGARVVVVALHGLGCDTCARGSAVVLALAERLGGARFVLGDYFTRGRLGSYRGSLALWCASEQAPDAAWRLFERLVLDFGDGTIAALAARASEAGLESEPFAACLREDRYLPLVFENVRFAERLGLERNVPGIFVDGVRLTDLASRDKIEAQLQTILARP